MAYPSSLDELTDGVPSDGAAPTTALDNATYPHDDHHRALGVAVEAIEAELGTDPSGSEATVKARIAATETVANAAAAKASNLSDLTSASSARTNLGLGGAATLAVGTTAGTVAAGDDSRITGAVPKSTVTTAGDLIYGTGNAAVSRLALGAAGQALTATSSGLTWLHQRLAQAKISAASYVGGAITGGVETNVTLSTTYPAFVPIWSDRAVSVDRVDIYVSSGSASGVARVALYSSTTAGLPSTLLASLGSPTTASTGWKSTTISETLPAGLSWARVDPNQNFGIGAYQIYQCPALFWVASGFQPVLYLEDTRGYDGSDPSPAPSSWTYKTGSVPVVRFRVA